MRRVIPANVSLCPRCGGYIPNADNPGAYPGALSRVDSRTEICSNCGIDEAMAGIDRASLVRDYTGWKNPPNEFYFDVEELLAAERLNIQECSHAEWRWLDCDDCRETIGACGEKVCVSCGASVE